MRPKADKKPERRPRALQALKILALAAASFLLVLVLVEVVFRTTHLFGARLSWAQPDPLIGWRFTPGATYWYDEENDHPIRGKINSFGWRDKEWLVEKPDNTYRIAVLGDSFVEAFQVESDSTFLAIAQRRLGRNVDRPVEMMNFGRMGMTQAEEYLVLLHEAVRFSPDVVVLFFVPLNDIGDIHRQTAINDLRPFFELSPAGELALDTSFNRRRQYKLKTLVNPFKQRSALISLLLEKYNTIRWSLRAARVAPPEKEKQKFSGFLSLCTSSPDADYVENYRLNKVLIRSMADFCRERGMRFVLVCLNTLLECGEASRNQEIDPSFDSGFFDEDLRELSDSLGIDYLGLEKPFQRCCDQDGRSWYWIHWNYTGHQAVADELVRKLESIL